MCLALVSSCPQLHGWVWGQKWGTEGGKTQTCDGEQIYGVSSLPLQSKALGPESGGKWRGDEEAGPSSLPP